MTESSTERPEVPEGLTEKYRMVDNPDGSGTKTREYYYVDASGIEVDAEGNPYPEPVADAGGAFTDAVEPAEQVERSPDENEQARKDSLRESSEALAAAREADDAQRQAWAEAGGDRIGDPPDPSVNEPGPDLTSATGDGEAEDDEDHTEAGT